MNGNRYIFNDTPAIDDDISGRRGDTIMKIFYGLMNGIIHRYSTKSKNQIGKVFINYKVCAPIGGKNNKAKSEPIVPVRK